MSRSDPWRFPFWAYFLGLALGFLGCSLAGRIASRQAIFRGQTRFTVPVQPQSWFYPTASELVSTVRRTVPKTKKLVVVGGASYFRGTGQNPDELWSLELQKQLGDGYAVVNFAIDQAGATAFAAVAFEVLSREYPDSIYVVNGSPVQADPPDGGDDYRYIFWDAYYKRMLPREVADAPAVQSLRRAQWKTREGAELHLGKLFDAVSYSCDLWTYLGYKQFFTVWSVRVPLTPFRARGEYHEGNDPNLRQEQANNRADSEHAKLHEARNLDFSRAGYDQQPDGTWQLGSSTWIDRQRYWAEMFPPDLRRRCFVVFLRANPFFMKGFTAADLARVEQTQREGRSAYEEVGYRVVPLAPNDLTADDYLDAGHFLASGGRKVAAAVVARIHQADRDDAADQQQDRLPPGPVEIQFAAPAAPGKTELLRLAAGPSFVPERLFAQRSKAGTIRLGYQLADLPAVYSSAWPNDRGTIKLSVSLSGLYPATGYELAKSFLVVTANGAPFWLAPITAQTARRAVPEFGPEVQEHHVEPFTPAAFRLPLTQSHGAAALIRPQREMAGRSLPLLTTGHSGAGDVISIRFTPAGALVVQYDRWGGKLQHSEAVPWGWGQERELEFQSTAVGAPEIVITLDGKVIWKPALHPYPATDAEVFYGQNPIYATSAESRLTYGAIERLLAP